MARTLEIVRQWELLQALDRAPHGLTLRRLAGIGRCSTRTIRRDLSALQAAGFPLYDEKIDGSPRWKLDRNPLKGMDAGFRLTELLALYFSRTLLETMVGLPFRSDVQTAFARLEKSLPPRMKAFLEQMPGVIKAKPVRMKLKPASDPRGDRTGRLMDAMLNQREVEMRYASASSGRTKDYVLHPYRLAYADGGLYLFGYVPAYGEVRTFALERIRNVSQLDTKFEMREALAPEVFPDSLGVFSGSPETISIEFDAAAAAFVRERQWHPSQQLTAGRHGGVVMTLKVCRDAALRSWILSFGPSARVLAPASLAGEIAAALEAAQARYARMHLAEPADAPRPIQRQLPFPPALKKLRAS